jgi:KDO2-lipid IV(A) lauroyltransferase
MRGLRRLDPDRSSDICGHGARRLGPWLPVSQTGRANLRAAFPEKTEAEIEEILAGVWENLGRVVGEFAHLDRLWDWDPLRPDQGRIISPHSDLFFEARDDGKPSLIFGAHLANWELVAVGAAAHGADAALLFRMPGVTIAAEIVQEIRSANMGRLVRSSRTAIFQLAREIEHGVNVGMLVDQYWTGGPLVTFFGRQCPVNPTIARLARQYECEIRGSRVVRLPEIGFEPKLPSRSICRAAMTARSTSMRPCR